MMSLADWPCFGTAGNVFPADSARFWSDRFGDAKENFSMTSFWNDHMAENMDQCLLQQDISNWVVPF
jgi:hypothetical protein